MPELTIYGVRNGEEVWVKWKDGEITSSSESLMEKLKELLHYVPDMGVSIPPFDEYVLRDIYEDHVTFYHIMRNRFIRNVTRVEGDVPKPRKTPDGIYD